MNWGKDDPIPTTAMAPAPENFELRLVILNPAYIEDPVIIPNKIEYSTKIWY